MPEKNQSESWKSPGNLFLIKATNPMKTALASLSLQSSRKCLKNNTAIKNYVSFAEKIFLAHLFPLTNGLNFL